MIEIFVYDAAGNVTYDGQNYYLYDGEGNLCASQRAIGGMITQYIYDADGNRVAKGYPTNASATLTCADPANMQNFNPTTIYQDNQEYAGDGVTLERTHVNVGQDEDATIDGSGTIHYQLTDWLHNRRMQVSAAGVVEGTYANLPFGDGLQVIGDDSDHKHFTGKERDPETATANGYDGLDYFGARYDASNIGRWLTPDWAAKAEPVPYAKLDDPQSLNLYVYVSNNPLTGIDADGHEQCDGGDYNWCPQNGWDSTVGPGPKGGDGKNGDGDTDEMGYSAWLDKNGLENDAEAWEDFSHGGGLEEQGTGQAKINAGAQAQYNNDVKIIAKQLGISEDEVIKDIHIKYDNGTAEVIGGHVHTAVDKNSIADKALAERLGSDRYNGGQGSEFSRLGGLTPSAHLDNGFLHVDRFNAGAWGGFGVIPHFFYDVLNGGSSGNVPMLPY